MHFISKTDPDKRLAREQALLLQEQEDYLQAAGLSLSVCLSFCIYIYLFSLPLSLSLPPYPLSPYLVVFSPTLSLPTCCVEAEAENTIVAFRRVRAVTLKEVERTTEARTQLQEVVALLCFFHSFLGLACCQFSCFLSRVGSCSVVVFRAMIVRFSETFCFLE